MYASSFDESILCIRDQLVHVWHQAVRQYLCNDFGNAIDQAYWSIISYGCCIRFFGRSTMFASFTRLNFVVR
jgi:hypothetical protein